VHGPLCETPSCSHAAHPPCTETKQVKKAIEKGNMDGAKIYGQNAIRKKNEQVCVPRAVHVCSSIAA